MKIFSPPDTSAIPKEAVNSKPKKGLKKGKELEAAPKKEVSANEIREKLATHVETSNSAKTQLIKKNSKALGAGFMSDEIKPLAVPNVKDSESLESPEVEESSFKKSHLLLSDVKLNDPNDSNTQEKLKSVLRNGAFNFNPREKETLEKILSGN